MAPKIAGSFHHDIPTGFISCVSNVPPAKYENRTRRIIKGNTVTSTSFCLSLNSLNLWNILNWFNAITSIGISKVNKSKGCFAVGSAPSIGIAGMEFISKVKGDIKVPKPKENPLPKR